MVHLDLFTTDELVGALALRCTTGCPNYPTLAPLDDSAIERLALDDLAAGYLHFDVLSGIRSSQALRVAGKVSSPGRVIFDWHGYPPNNRLERSRGASSVSQGGSR